MREFQRKLGITNREENRDLYPDRVFLKGETVWLDKVTKWLKCVIEVLNRGNCTEIRVDGHVLRL